MYEAGIDVRHSQAPHADEGRVNRERPLPVYLFNMV